MMRSCGSICTSVVAWPYEPKVPTLPRVSFAPRSVLARTPRPNLFFRSYRGAFEKAFIGADARLFASLCEGSARFVQRVCRRSPHGGNGSQARRCVRCRRSDP